MATATIPTTVPPEMARLREAMDKRCVNRRRIALRISYLKNNPDRIYKILDGTRPMPATFIDDVCDLTGIEYKDVLPPDDYREYCQMLRDEMHLQDAERMGY